jgi:hypothetical protein
VLQSLVSETNHNGGPVLASDSTAPGPQSSSAPNSTAPLRPRGPAPLGPAPQAPPPSADTVVGRAASWAVAFDKLLADKVGLLTFTVSKRRRLRRKEGEGVKGKRGSEKREERESRSGSGVGELGCRFR